MNEDYFLRCRVWATISWVLVAVLLLAAWVVMLAAPSQWKLAFLLGGTACVISPVAAVLHIRSFHVRLSALIRVANGMNGTDRSERGVYPIR